MKDTEIAWCDDTFNPWWGCMKVSEGCTHCYAETFAKRVGLNVWGPAGEHRRFGDKHWLQPERWNAEAEKEGRRRRVFCASMADIFEGRPEDAADRERLFELIERTPWLDWLLLTKRPENMVRLAPERWAAAWPRNVWAGTTVENQQAGEERIPHLLRVPAVVRFLSCEPLLEQLELELHLNGGKTVEEWTARALSGFDPYGFRPSYPRIDWVIVGGESGPRARPFDVAWARSLVEQCRAAGVAVFVKQLGAHPVGGRLPSGRSDIIEGRWIKHPKGGDPLEWPEDLRIRQFPTVR